MMPGEPTGQPATALDRLPCPAASRSRRSFPELLLPVKRAPSPCSDAQSPGGQALLARTLDGVRDSAILSFNGGAVMVDAWQSRSRCRMDLTAMRRPPRANEVLASVKIRAISGCFHREHSPQAYRTIDSYIDSLEPGELNCAFQEHESGPELLVYLAATTAGVTLAKGVIELITAIIKARREGIRSGDEPRSTLRLIIRRTLRDGSFQEEEAMELETHSPEDIAAIERSLLVAAARLLRESAEAENEEKCSRGPQPSG